MSIELKTAELTEPELKKVELKEFLLAEKNVLSALLYYYEDICDIVNIDEISINLFQTHAARRVFQSLRNTKLDKNGNYDYVFVLNNLKNFCYGMGELNSAIEYLEELDDNVKYYLVRENLDLLYQIHVKKNLDKLAKTIGKTYLSFENFNNKIEIWKTEFLNIVSLEAGDCDDINMDQCIKTKEQEKEENEKSENNKYLKTGYWALDKYIKGLKPGRLMVIASRPGIGKTTFALNLLFNNLNNVNRDLETKPAIMFFSLEMTISSMIDKLTALETKLSLDTVTQEGGISLKSFEKIAIKNAYKKFKNAAVYWSDKTNLDKEKIAAVINNLIKKYDIKFVVIDYLQLINPSKEERMDNLPYYQRIGDITRFLKKLSLDLNICIVILSQLNRKSEDRADKIPLLSDLRESGNIEQDADVVMMLYETTKDKNNNDKNNNKNYSSDTKMSLKIAKNRWGGLKTIDFIFHKYTGVFSAR